MSKAEESIDGMGKFNEKIYEDGITWLFGNHCLECGHLTFAQHEVKELAKYFYELSHQAEKDLELGWEDIRELYIIFAEVDTEIELCKTDIKSETIGYYQEVLKRFKERKVDYGKESLC